MMDAGTHHSSEIMVPIQRGKNVNVIDHGIPTNILFLESNRHKGKEDRSRTH